MSLTLDELDEHCRAILSCRLIKNRIIILCEGSIEKAEGRLLPHLYGKMEQMPDANFYRACLPRKWRAYRPKFFNCGGRTTTIATYFRLLELHEEDPVHSYLTPEKLYAIVDLDLQVQEIADYDFSDTEEIFSDLYNQSRVNAKNADKHRIWVTGLIHKEAYFLIPELQDVFDNLLNPPMYKDKPLNLDRVYMDMAEAIATDTDLCDNWTRACDRVRHCATLDSTKCETLRDSWKTCFQTASRPEKLELIRALLTIQKAKNYWNQVEPPDDYSLTDTVFRDDAMLRIAEWYSNCGKDNRHHIPFLLGMLYEREFTA